MGKVLDFPKKNRCPCGWLAPVKIRTVWRPSMAVLEELSYECPSCGVRLYVELHDSKVIS
jgi:hypothetical protein